MPNMSRFQRTIVDASGNIQASPTITVRDASTNALVSLFSNRAGTTGITNPFTGTVDGFAAFYVAGGAYNVTATKGAFTITWNYVAVGTAQEYDIEGIQDLITASIPTSFGDGTALLPSIKHTGDVDTGFWFPAANTIAASTGGVERIRIASDGWVKIGAGTPEYPFHSSTRAGFSASQTIGTMISATSFAGGLEVKSNSATDAAFMAFHRPSGYAMYFGLDTDDYFAVGGWSKGAALGNFKCGTLVKSSGSFKIDHPLEDMKDTHHLVHSFIEGPNADNIYRGTVKLVAGSAVVDLDLVSRMSSGTFVALNHNAQCFTANESGWAAVKGSLSGSILTINCQDATSTDQISWLVIGERKDPAMINADWTDENGRVIVEPEKQA